jgi:hypothetical protein
MLKWYRAVDDTSIYFVAHGRISFLVLTSSLTGVSLIVLHPTYKLEYIKEAWDTQWFDAAYQRLKDIVSYPIFIH